MKKKFLITSAAISLSALLGVGAAVGIMNAKEPVKAEAATSGSLIAKLGNVGKWSENSAKLCAYLTDDSSDYWTSLQTIDSGTSIYKLDYSIDFTPTKLIFVRMNPAATSGNWSQKWNQTGDLGWNEATYLQDQWDPSASQCSQWTVSAQVRSSTVESFGTKTTLSTIGINDAGNPEVSGSVTLVEDEEFKILAGDGVWSGFYGCPDAIDSCFSGGSKTERSDSNPNIVCEVAGTYDFFFDTELKKVWLTRQDIVDADGYARYFLENVGCDPTGVELPSGWSTCATQYASLNAAAKDYLYAASADAEGDYIGQALYQYDWAVAHHSTLEKFVKDSDGHVRAIHTFIADGHYSLFTADSTTTIALITIVAVTSITAIGAIVFLRVRKHQ